MNTAIKCINEFPPSTEVKYDEELWYRQHGHAFVIINCKASSIYYPEHWTPLSLKCAFNGKEFYKLSNTTYAVNDRQFLVMNQGSQYASYILSDSVTESFTLNFTQENLGQLSNVYQRSSMQLLDQPFQLVNGSTTFMERLYEYNPSMGSKIHQLRALTSSSATDHFLITEILYQVLEELFMLNAMTGIEAEGVLAKKTATRQELYKRLCIAKDYLSSCYAEELNLDKLAATCFLNPYYLLREFRKLYKLTPHQYLTSVRLQEAERLLANPALTIREVLSEVGFQDPTSFGRLFKRHYGVSPLAYRNRKL